MSERRRAYLTPHPPLLVPEVGRGRDSEIASSAQAMAALADDLDRDPPETLVVMSPHAPIIGHKVAVIAAGGYTGSLAQFGAPEMECSPTCDEELARAITDHAAGESLLVETGSIAPLDHGAVVPLSFLDREGRFPLVLMSIALSGMAAFERLGAAIGKAAQAVGRRIVFVGSGDLSHRLTPSAPAGYEPDASRFDAQIVSILRKGDLERLADLDPELVELAGECGLRSIYTAAGFVGPEPSVHEVLAYEGPFGVGYMTAKLGS